ncbi:MAG: 4Fe-4S binding protein [Rhodobacterales bacterium]|nr:4Fe-4S binding protein [Rhodobacterales bacterium]
MSKRLILCDCSGTQSLDKDALSSACGLDCSRVYSALCTTEINAAAEEIAKGDALIACQQERAFFEELGDEIGVEPAGFIDLRDRAGWGDTAAAHPASGTAKMAALISDAMLPHPAEKALDIISEGRCLILGAPDITLATAAQLAEALSVAVLLDTPSAPPVSRNFDVVIGTLKRATGTLGAFAVDIDALQQIQPGGRGDFAFTAPRDGGKTECDIILDLRGATPLFSAHEKRDGYLRADPRDPAAVANLVFEAATMVGTFEKPIHVRIDAPLCAHSRARITGCSKCLDVCPIGAILPDGDHVTIDPLICAGCSACATLCPSGAITYDAPPTAFTFKRIENLASAYLSAGGQAPRLLVHDGDFGLEMISLAARYGRGLPADVIPLEMAALTGFGHAEILAALACGFIHVDVLLSPKTDPQTIHSEAALALAIIGAPRARILDLSDPEALSDALYSFETTPLNVEPILPMGDRGQISRLAAITLRDDVETPIPLPENAPYGGLVIDTDACTLCLSCAALCPTGALADNPDLPQLRFQEDACIQCGLCTRLCPENALTLKPQFNLSKTAYTQKVIHEEDPFACIECGALFGVKSSIERIVEKLADKHPMFTGSDNARLIQMCDTCRIEAQYAVSDNPFQGGERPKTVTTDDYFAKRKDH